MSGFKSQIEPLQEQHLCDEKVWGYIELKKSSVDGWVFWADDEPITEINYCPWCGADLDPERRFLRAS